MLQAPSVKLPLGLLTDSNMLVYLGPVSNTSDKRKVTEMTGTTYSLERNIDLASYDYILVNSSAGKDSQAMLTAINALAADQGVTDRVIVVHADLGRVEWEGTKALAAEQAAHYGNRFEVCRNANWQDLLHRIESRGQWPGAATRYCTGEFKRNPVATLCTRLAKERRDAGHYGRVRILNCLGIRAEESRDRAKKAPFVADSETRKGQRPNTRRQVDVWFPIFHWSVDEVWSTIRASGVPHHKAYDLGMPRLSCVFCVFAPEHALLIAGHHNRALLSDYAAAEVRMNHTFKRDLAIITIQHKLESGYIPGGTVDAATWVECGG